jgi:hypothetical protein
MLHGQLRHDGEGIVGAAVRDENEFVRSLCSFERGQVGVYDRADVIRLVVDG